MFGVCGIYIGCLMFYGFGVMGEVGVMKVLEIIYKELDVMMVFCGCMKIIDVDKIILFFGFY